MPAKTTNGYEVHQDQLRSVSNDRTEECIRPTGLSGMIGHAKVPPIPFLMILFALAATGQTFSSGSTGADGALDLTSGDKTVQLPASGVLNYTTVNIPGGRTLKFVPNLNNTPVVILAQGAVNIAGTIDISGWGRTPGPGGFYGGAPGQPGFGPSPGQPIYGQQNATWLGPLSLVPNIGGSGGGGIDFNGAYDGGGGGGAITIASTTSITVTAGGIIDARNGARAFSCGYIGCWFSAGADGAIRLVANNVTVSGCNPSTCSYLAAATIRLEAPTGNVTYSEGGTSPVVISTINPTVIPTHAPMISIVSVGGYPVPTYSGSRLNTVDLLLPTQLPDPIPVVVQGLNVPVGSNVVIQFSGSIGATSTTAALSGTTASSTATVYVSGLNRTDITYLFVTTTFDATLLSQNLDKQDPEKIMLSAGLGGKIKYRFLRNDGSEVQSHSRSPAFRHFFGL